MHIARIFSSIYIKKNMLFKEIIYTEITLNITYIYKNFFYMKIYLDSSIKYYK